MPSRKLARSSTLSNSDISELLAVAAQTAKMPAAKALRRASRRALFWPEEAAELKNQGRSLTELTSVGSYLARLISDWLEATPEVPPRPDLRRGFLTLTEARGILKKRPQWLRAVKGDLQMHSVWSDGEGTIPEMVEAARERGYEYIAITDHTKGLKIAGGIDEAQVETQGREIATLNDELCRAGEKLRILRSVELNLNPRGEGDMDESCLAGLDIVLGCFHSSLRTKEDQTERYLAALRNPSIHILGHPRGRVYNFRLGLIADWPRVFATAAALDKAVEIDGYPDRQDLNVALLKVAKKEGCRISLGTDAHGPSQLAFMEYSAAAALKAAIPSHRILNFMSADELLAWSGRAKKS